ncbi:MAG TPA: S8 family serine peptidase [Pyrinomonadaceae bacterium]|nr:S8 family serine peptidase [Pyrinomonadaceae bacterium]
MKRSLLIRSLFLALGVAILLALAPLPYGSAGASVKTVIVELSSEPVVVAKFRAESVGRGFDPDAYRRQIVAEQDALLNRARAAGIIYTVSGVNAPNGDATANIEFRFNYVYNGVTLEVPAAAIPLLRGLDGVKGVHEATEVYATLDRAVGYTRASQLYGTPPKLDQFEERDTGGLHGEGMIVAVIDTGVDWTHPMFGGDPTPPQFGVGPAMATRNQKVIYYLNLTAGAVSDDFGHGTHVASDIAGYQAIAPTSGADGVPYTGGDVKIHGIAPRARIMAYKTLSGAGVGLNPSTIMAIEDAVQPRTISGYPKPVPHVINLSLGSAAPGGNNPDHPTAVACDNATLAGVTVVASAGNDGRAGAVTPNGEATIGSPGAGRRVLTVGANNDPGSLVRHIIMDRAFDNGAPPDLVDVLDPAGINVAQMGLVDGSNKVTAAGQRTDINIQQAGGSPYITSPVAQYYVFAGTVTTAADVPDSVAGRIAVARLSGAFATSANSFAAKGAAAVLAIRPDLATITVAQSTIPVLSITESDAAYLLDLLSSADNDAGEPAKGALSEFPIRFEPGSYQPAMADFSSKGPVGGFGQIKPDITAPGVNILAATVRVGSVAANGGTMFDPTGYLSASGTSFSSPITAGVATLIKQKNILWTPAMIRASLVNTATNLRREDGTPLADGANTLNEQGGGLIDATAAANAKALMGTGAPGPTGEAPMARPFQIGVSPLVGTSPGNPDFSASYSFASVPVAGVIGSSLHSQTVNIYDVSEGGGAGTYMLTPSNVRNLDGSSFRVEITDDGGNSVSEVTVPANGSASFRVNLVADAESAADATQVQWYVTATRTDGGQRLRMPFYFRATRPTIAAAAPAIGGVSGNEVADAPAVDINGAYRLQFSKPSTGAQASKLRVEESDDNGATWATLADVDAAQTAFDISDRANGTYLYRVKGLFPVQHGMIAGPSSATATVRVDRRVEQDATALIEAAIVDNTFSFAGGVTQFDQTLRNASAGTTLYPTLRFVVTSVESSSGRVKVSNADNGGDGTAGAPAIFDYSGAFGFDFAPSESSAAKRLRFSNPASELFRLTVFVYAHVADPAFAQGPPSGGAGASGGDSAEGGSSTTGGTSTQQTVGGVTLPTVQAKPLIITVNPLTGKVGIVK